MLVLSEQTDNTLGIITYYTKLKFGFLVIRENLVSSFSFVVRCLVMSKGIDCISPLNSSYENLEPSFSFDVTVNFQL